MRDSTFSAAGRAAALVLAVLTVIAAANTVVIAIYALDHDQVLGGVGVAALAGAGIAVVLGAFALRLWRR